MLLTATIFTILALSGLSYLFDRPFRTEETETERGVGENRVVESVSEQEQAGTGEVATDGFRVEKVIYPSKDKQKGTTGDSELVGGIHKEKSPPAVISLNLRSGEISQTVAGGSKDVPQTPKADGSRQGSGSSLLSHLREASPQRAKAKKPIPARAGSSERSKCPNSSPVSGIHFSSGYVFAKQASGGPSPRLY